MYRTKKLKIVKTSINTIKFYMDFEVGKHITYILKYNSAVRFLNLAANLKIC